MLNVAEHCQDKLEATRAFADSCGPEWRKQFEARLSFLDTYAEHGDRGKTRCQLYTDFAPYSFYFVMERRAADGEYSRWFEGGLIFHGPHDNGGDGGAPTFSVNIGNGYGWSIHT